MAQAIVALSKMARDLALNIRQKANEYTIYTMPRQLCSDLKPIEGSLKEFTGYLFERYETLVFIMATGIVVRIIAPYLQHKSVDPAVLVLDSSGRHVISLLSGHLGGANEKAIELAELIGATPVITTASDLSSKPAVDMLAKQKGLIIKDYTRAKELTALIIEEKMIGILSDFPVKFNDLPANVRLVDAPLSGLRGLIYITNKLMLPALNYPVVQLIAPSITIGIGCKRGISEGQISAALDSILRQLNIAKQAVNRVASIDLKKDEPGIIALARNLGAEYITYPVEKLQEVEQLFTGSAFVKKTVGVAAVCEPAGYLASNYGRCLLPQKKCSGLTISVWQEEVKL